MEHDYVKWGEEYAYAWSGMLQRWFSWPSERTRAFIAGWMPRMCDSMFYHEPPGWYIVPLIVEHAKQESPSCKVDSKQLERELIIAIGHNSSDLSYTNYNWDAAYVRIKEIIDRYEAKMPPVTYISEYERRVISNTKDS